MNLFLFISDVLRVKTSHLCHLCRLSLSVKQQWRSSTGACCLTSPGCWWRLCTCRLCCSSPSLRPGSSSGSTPPSAGVRRAVTWLPFTCTAVYVTCLMPQVLRPWPSWSGPCWKNSLMMKGELLICQHVNIFTVSFNGWFIFLYVQVLGQPGEPLVVDNKDSHSALHLCKHTFCPRVQLIYPNTTLGSGVSTKLTPAAQKSTHHPEKAQHFGKCTCRCIRASCGRR